MSWLYSQALVEEYSEDISSDGEPSALSNGKPTQLPSWCSDKTMANCQLSQSGMTFKPLTEDHGEAVLMSFLEAFPVRTLAAPAKAKASKETDHPCGNTWRESLEKFGLDTHTWKTHQCLWDEDLQPSSVILPKWGMMLSGVLWERTTLPRLTSGTGSGSSGSWPTPTCQEVEHPDAELTDTGRRLSKDGKSSHSLNLADSVKQWPTPCTRDYKGANAEDGLIRNDGKSRMDQLPNAVAHGDTPEPSGQLNPTWVEWLMGWPIGWTSMDAIEDLDWRGWETDPADEGEVPRVATGIKHRVGRLKAIGNGQVPQVAAMAWNILSK